MAVLGLRFCARAFSSCGKQGPLLIAVHGPFIIAASLIAEHRLQVRRLSNCGSQAQLLRGMWDPPRPGLEPVSPALAGRFSTTAPPGKPHLLDLCLHSFSKVLDHLHYHYSEFFFWKVAYLHFIWLFFWGFILFLHLVQSPLPFHFVFLWMWFSFHRLQNCSSSSFCLGAFSSRLFLNGILMGSSLWGSMVSWGTDFLLEQVSWLRFLSNIEDVPDARMKAFTWGTPVSSGESFIYLSICSEFGPRWVILGLQRSQTPPCFGPHCTCWLWALLGCAGGHVWHGLLCLLNLELPFSQKSFFWCGPFLKSLLNLLQYCFCFMFWFYWPWGIWDLSSLTRDETHTPCNGRRSLKHWTAREVPLAEVFTTAFSLFLQLVRTLHFVQLYFYFTGS